MNRIQIPILGYAFMAFQYPSSHVTTVAEEFNGNGGLKLAFNQNSFCYRGISFLTLLPPCLFTTLHDQGCVIPCKICATIIFHFSQHMPSISIVLNLLIYVQVSPFVVDQ